MSGTVETLPEYDAELDTRGLFCPEPIMMLHNQVAAISPGQVLHIIATDPATTRDVPKFCQFLDHKLVTQTTQGNEFHYFIRINA